MKGTSYFELQIALSVHIFWKSIARNNLLAQYINLIHYFMDSFYLPMPGDDACRSKSATWDSISRKDLTLSLFGAACNFRNKFIMFQLKKWNRSLPNSSCTACNERQMCWYQNQKYCFCILKLFNSIKWKQCDSSILYMKEFWPLKSHWQPVEEFCEILVGSRLRSPSTLII